MRPKGSAELLSDRRKRALKLLDEEFSLNEIARRLHCAASSVMRWRNEWRRRGADSLRVRFSPGRPRRLTRSQERRLLRILLKGAVVPTATAQNCGRQSEWRRWFVESFTWQ